MKLDFTWYAQQPSWMSLIHIGWDFWYERSIEITLFGLGVSIGFGVSKKWNNHENAEKGPK